MQIYTTRETEDQLRKLAKDQGKSIAEIVRQLVKQASEAKKNG